VADLIFSVDVELGLGAFHSKSPLRDKKIDIINERKAIPKIISLCKKNKIKPTFAVCGHLFLRFCNAKHFFGSKKLLPWLSEDPATAYPKNNEWYAPDIVQMIKKSGFEIASHSFSHASLVEMPKNMAECEIKECVRLARAQGIKLKSFIFPRDETAYLDVIQRNGFTHFASKPTQNHFLLNKNSRGFYVCGPKIHKNGLIEVPKTIFINQIRAVDLLKILLIFFQAAILNLSIHIWAHSFNFKDESYFKFLKKVFFLSRIFGLKSKSLSEVRL